VTAALPCARNGRSQIPIPQKTPVHKARNGGAKLQVIENVRAKSRALDAAGIICVIGVICG
jgi:hypothetical protein